MNSLPGVVHGQAAVVDSPIVVTCVAAAPTSRGISAGRIRGRCSSASHGGRKAGVSGPSAYSASSSRPARPPSTARGTSRSGRAPPRSVSWSSFSDTTAARSIS